MKILPSVWASLVNFSRGIIAEEKAKYPQVPIEFIDWEAHANIHELPDTDLIGPTALTITEHSPQMFEVNFSIAVSSYETDKNLFRLRDYLSTAFEKLRPLEQIKIYDSATAQEVGYLIMANGTFMAPMSRAETRPWQYVQATGLLEPSMT